MRLSDSLILENISVSPFCRLAKRTKEKHLHISADAKKMTILPSFDESATKSAFCRKLPQVCQVRGKFPNCRSNCLSHYLLALIIPPLFIGVNKFFQNSLDLCHLLWGFVPREMAFFCKGRGEENKKGYRFLGAALGVFM